MNYKAIYDRLIEKGVSRTRPDGYFESHHIVPRCVGGTDDPANLVLLTPEEHYVAHLLLVKIYNYQHGLVNAAMFMCTRPNNKVYGWLRRRLSDNMKKKNPNHGGAARRAYIEKHGVPSRVKYDMSDEEKLKLSVRMKANNPVHRLEKHPNTTEVGKVDPVTLKTIHIYSSMKEAVVAEKFTSSIYSKIDKQILYKGFYWIRINKDIRGRWQRK